MDTYHPTGFGGSGRTGDWAYFARLRTEHTTHQWILAGGISPENVAAALRQSEARSIDVNSGVESAPGVKDAGKLTALASAIRKHVANDQAPPH
jgi:phosphoribosylanthranilate isomerase